MAPGRMLTYRSTKRILDMHPGPARVHRAREQEMNTVKVQGLARDSRLECFHCTKRADLALVTLSPAGIRIGYRPVCAGAAVDTLARMI